MNMRQVLCALMVTGAVAAGALVPAGAQAANVSVNFDAGNVAFGFSDGYWDHNHAWHPWPSTAVRNQWRTRNKGHYYANSHTHYKGAGWRNNDRYWEHH